MHGGQIGAAVQASEVGGCASIALGVGWRLAIAHRVRWGPLHAGRRGGGQGVWQGWDGWAPNGHGSVSGAGARGQAGARMGWGGAEWARWVRNRIRSARLLRWRGLLFGRPGLGLAAALLLLLAALGTAVFKPNLRSPKQNRFNMLPVMQTCHNVLIIRGLGYRGIDIDFYAEVHNTAHYEEPTRPEHSGLHLGSSLLLQYLDTWLRQVDLEGHLLPHEDVWVAGLWEERLQDVQLCAGEGGALPALLPGSGWKKWHREGIIVLTSTEGRQELWVFMWVIWIIFVEKEHNKRSSDSLDSFIFQLCVWMTTNTKKY